LEAFLILSSQIILIKEEKTMKPKPNVIVSVLCLCILLLSQLVLLHPVMAGSTKISAAGDNSFVLKSDGTLWAWGANNKAQLGDGTTTNRAPPMQIGADKDWVSIATGTYMGAYVFALKTDGSVWAWGNNEFAQLGDGTNKNKSSPARIGTAKTGINHQEIHTMP
jgi:alpha-tubulin suppressor-like RCC1 family protein